MKKLILGLLVVLFLVTLVYAETDNDLKNEIATTVKAEVETQVATDNSNKILQEYISFCRGNEELGEILYDERDGKASKANLLGQFVIWKHHLAYLPEVTFELALTGFYPSSSIIGLINHYYPNGIWIVDLKKEEIEHIPGPLVGVLKALEGAYDATKAWEVSRGQYTPGEGEDKSGINAYLAYYIFDEKHWYPIYSFVSKEYRLESRFKSGKIRKFGIIYNDSIFKDFTDTVFENEKSAQEFLDKYKAKKEKEKKKAIKKKEKEKKKQERKKARDKKWNEWFH